MANVEQSMRLIEKEVRDPRNSADVTLLAHYLSGFNVNINALIQSSGRFGERVPLSASLSRAEQALLWEFAWRQWAWIADENCNVPPESRHSNPFFNKDVSINYELDTPMRNENIAAQEFLESCRSIEEDHDWPHAERASSVARNGLSEGTDQKTIDQELYAAQKMITRVIFRGEPEAIIRCSTSVLDGFFENRWEDELKIAGEFVDEIAPLLLLCYCRIREQPDRFLTIIEEQLMRHCANRNLFMSALQDDRSILFWSFLATRQPIHSRKRGAEGAYISLRESYEAIRSRA